MLTKWEHAKETMKRGEGAPRDRDARQHPESPEYPRLDCKSTDDEIDFQVDALDLDAKTQPPDRELTKAMNGVGRCEQQQTPKTCGSGEACW